MIVASAYLIVNIEQSEVIPSCSEEVSPSVISIHSPVLGAIEYGVVDRQHGGDGQYLFTALVPEGGRVKMFSAY